MIDPANLLSYLFTLWILLTYGTYAVIRLYLHNYGTPDGWRFNQHGARPFPGHLSFYERDGGNALVLNQNLAFPLYWKARTTPEPGAYLNLETQKHGPVWRVVQWAHDWMEPEPETGNVTGLICSFCGKSGFQSEDELDDHIDSHPFTTRRDTRNE